MTQHFKVLKGSETFQKITDLFARMAECNKANREFAESIGADITAGLLTSSNYIAGGVVGFKIDLQPEDAKLWRQAIRGQHYGYYFPRSGKPNKEILEKIHALPKILSLEVNDVLGFNKFLVRAGILPFDDYILIEIPHSAWEGGTYEPFSDMIEILGSEYQILKNVEKSEPSTT